jgi:hypothetical protein
MKDYVSLYKYWITLIYYVYKKYSENIIGSENNRL